MVQRAQNADQSYSTGLRVQIIVILIAGIVGGLLTVILIKNIVTPLNLAVEVAERVANGDLSSGKPSTQSSNILIKASCV